MSTSPARSGLHRGYTISPSRMLIAAMALPTGLALLALVHVPGLEPIIRAGGAVLTLWLAARAWHWHGPWQARSVCRLTALCDGYWRLERADGRCLVARQRAGVALPGMVLLTCGGGPWRRCIGVLPDALDHESRRQLRRQVNGW